MRATAHAALACALVSAACLAQETPLHRRVTVKYDNLPVAEALKDLGAKAGVTFAGAEKWQESVDHVTYAVADQEAGRVAVRILRPRGLKIEKVDGSQVTLGKRDSLDEFNVKREATFEFAAKPKVTREGDRISIAFETKALCDVTVAIENADGRIIRHLACGVLGENAPDPFLWNAKKQLLVWDGKNDQDIYVDDKDSHMVRVSLGLKPQFERTLFWSPQKRLGGAYPVVCPAPEGVYVAETYCLDHGTHGGTQLLQFDHDGNYVRTVYPFPAGKVGDVKGLETHTFTAAGLTVPLKHGYYQATLLPVGTVRFTGGMRHVGGLVDTGGSAYRGPAMAVRDHALALCYGNLARLGTDGSSGGLELVGPRTSIDIAAGGSAQYEVACPISGALSPDHKWFYLAGYQFAGGDPRNRSWLCGVTRVPFNGAGEMTVFAGTIKPGEENGGTADGQFRVAPSVACDARGRVYAADYMNDRVQVFDADGKHLKSIPVQKPASVAVHHKSGDIYVFSWMLVNRLITSGDTRVEPTFTHLGPFEDPKVKATGPLPLYGHGPGVQWNATGGVEHRVGLDSWTEPPTIWVINGLASAKVYNDGGGFIGARGEWDACSFALYKEGEGGKLTPGRRFSEDVKKAVVRSSAPPYWRQRLYVNPANSKLYLGEPDSGVDNTFNQLVEIDPRTGKTKLVDLPLGAEDLCFDLNGLAYIRTDVAVARYDPISWREVPWDYGEEFKNHSYGMGAKGTDLLAALRTPGGRSANFWHLGGIDVSARGHLVVTTHNWASYAGLESAVKFGPGKAPGEANLKPYAPAIYPGRTPWGELHVWDKHGNLIREDAAPGMGHLNGVAIDRDDNIYMLAASRRIIDGKLYDPEMSVSGTVLKVPACKSKALSPGGTAVLLPPESQPKRSQDLAGYTSGWVEGAEWFYGGVGFCTPGGCVCVNGRFDVDYFNRTFAPEPQLYGVAVLDSSGNLILRVGKYGNVQDGKPLIAAGGPAETRAIGGDEVGLFYANYVASETDRRLFIADQGNARIVSVKLGYHTEEKLALKDAPEQKK